jgi:hypothetical protein
LARAIAPRLGVTVKLAWEEDQFTATVTATKRPRRAPTKVPEPRLPRDALDERVLGLLDDGVPRSRKEVASALGVPAPTVRDALRRLEVAGRIRSTAASRRSPNQRWTRAR